ncbi:DUF2344 domain-containing protein [Vallitalea pronyensis]|uniref:DUF2344 domain-containing protein n=1 Tax=Vallitalea pronyensis TaxID=1348613 RepID=A0A8J8MLD7_9FIRM|nr:TIGR03936 family radical SAM-associated protein [Vallitalea pronyensis]QUI23433.1 DUF2344 domain-containing protein [Vallitalea pronyensis]
MLIRIKFAKKGTMKFIGHLDLIRNFQRVFKKSGFPIAYSEGFNPHQIMSIGAPLSVGVTSDGEYMDVKTTENIDCLTYCDILNRHTPTGLVIISMTELPDKAKSAMALIDAAKYKVTLKHTVITEKMINKLMTMEEIMIHKKNKKNVMREINIKPGIFHMALPEPHTLILLLATGSHMNIKPEVVLQSLCEVNDIPYDKYDYTVHREEIYYKNDQGFMPLNHV